MQRCEAGEAPSCEVACSEGVGAGCNRTGVALEQRGDHPAAISAYVRGCEAASGLACSNLGVLRVKAGETAAAVEAFQKACALKSALGCANLGVMTYRGDGVAKSRELGIDHLRTACRLGHAASCEQLNAWGMDPG